MERPPQHVIETESTNIFSQAIPPEWINRHIEHDYGLDRSVEVVEGGKVTGKELLVQLKGTNNIGIADGFVSYSFEVKNLKYYLARDTPVILTVVDIPSKKCYWLFIQEYLYDTLNQSNPQWTNQTTVTIKIPVLNEITSTIPRLKEVAVGGSPYLIAKRLGKIPNEQLEHWKDNSEAIPKLLKLDKKLAEKQFQIRFDVAYRLQKENEYTQSYQLLIKTVEQAKAEGDSVTQIKAVLIAVYQLNPSADRELIVELLESIGELVQKSKDLSFELIWRSEYLETIFATLMRNLTSTRLMHLVSSQTEGSSITPFLNVSIAEIIQNLYEVEKEFISLVEKAFKNNQFLIYLDLLRRLAKMQFLWCYNNTLDVNPSDTYSQINSVEKTFIVAEKLSTLLSKDHRIEINLDLARLYNSIEQKENCDKHLKIAMELAKEIEHKGFQTVIQSAQESFKTEQTIPTMIRTKNAPKPTEDISDEEEEEMLKMLLEKAGIDLKSDDSLSRLAKIGLKDRNPERVLKYCEFLHTEIVNYGPIWDMVGLPSTGNKILFCEKKSRAIIGRELDGLLGEFQKEFCEKCTDHHPRPEEWKWTHKWQRKQPELMKQYIRNYFKN